MVANDESEEKKNRENIFASSEKMLTRTPRCHCHTARRRYIFYTLQGAHMNMCGQKMVIIQMVFLHVETLYNGGREI